MRRDLRLLDLTHIISPETPTFDGACGFRLQTATDYKDCEEPNLFRVQKMEANAGIGTHMDAPAHCIPNGKTMEELAMEDLAVDCAVIRVENAEAKEDHVILPEAVETFEKEHGQIQPNTLVIFHTGWDRFWEDRDKYLNGNKFPGVHPDTAELLVARAVAGIGTDTLSTDTGPDDFPVHRIVLGAGKYLVENVANAGKLPPTGAKVLVLPMKMQGATEAPVRLVGIL